MNFMNNPLKITLYSFILMIAVSVAACASAGETKATADNSGTVKSTGNTSVKKEGTKYEDYLVDVKSYSTNGGYYQNKYLKDIISITKNITEKQDIDISKGSVGFYYDKKSKRTDRLFFGFDIVVNSDSKLDYSRYSVKLIKENVPEVIEEIYKFRLVSNENEVVGVVIGFKWNDMGVAQQVNIWLKKEDVDLFLAGRLTANEMFQRGTITNSSGRVILLPL